MARLIGLFSLTIATASGKAQIATYEADDLPVSWGWTLAQRVCDPESWIDLGQYHQIVDHRTCPPPGGGDEAFTRALIDFDGEPRFFLEVRLEGDGPRSEIPFGAPAAFALSGSGGVRYTFFIARDQAKLNRDNRLPIVFVDLEPGTAHTHRLELYNDDIYIWYIDGLIVDSGVPEGQFPSFDPFILWDGRARYSDNVVHWDYIRYGRIAEDGSGDFDSDGDIDLRDVYYFVECLESSGPAAGSGQGQRA